MKACRIVITSYSIHYTKLYDLDDKSKTFSEFNKKQIDAILNPFNENLKEFKATVKETYEKGLKERSELGAELKNIQELNLKLSEEASNLTKASYNFV